MWKNLKNRMIHIVIGFETNMHGTNKTKENEFIT